MKRYRLIKDYPGGCKRGMTFILVSESEFIGVKEFVLQEENLLGKLIVSSEQLRTDFRPLRADSRRQNTK